jgi:hypothetical protein
MNPFLPAHDWYEKHWYTPEPETRTWTVASVLASAAGFLVAAWFG